MICAFISYIHNRHIRRGFAQPEAHTRASTKLTEPYEKRRTRDLRNCRERFQNGTAGRNLA